MFFQTQDNQGNNVFAKLPTLDYQTYHKFYSHTLQEYLISAQDEILGSFE